MRNLRQWQKVFVFFFRERLFRYSLLCNSFPITVPVLLCGVFLLVCTFRWRHTNVEDATANTELACDQVVRHTQHISLCLSGHTLNLGKGGVFPRSWMMMTWEWWVIFLLWCRRWPFLKICSFYRSINVIAWFEFHVGACDRWISSGVTHENIHISASAARLCTQQRCKCKRVLIKHVLSNFAVLHEIKSPPR